MLWIVYVTVLTLARVKKLFQYLFATYDPRKTPGKDDGCLISNVEIAAPDVNLSRKSMRTGLCQRRPAPRLLLA